MHVDYFAGLDLGQARLGQLGLQVRDQGPVRIGVAGPLIAGPFGPFFPPVRLGHRHAGPPSAVPPSIGPASAVTVRDGLGRPSCLAIHTLVSTILARSMPVAMPSPSSCQSRSSVARLPVALRA